MTLDKIKLYVHEHVIGTIDNCVEFKDIETLERWLVDCKREIQRREEAKENTFPLYYEKAYLEMVLN